METDAIHSPFRIKHREDLLAQVAHQLQQIEPDVKLGTLELDLVVAGARIYTFSLQEGLGALVEDLFWDERGDWKNATRAIVRTI